MMTAISAVVIGITAYSAYDMPQADAENAAQAPMPAMPVVISTIKPQNLEVWKDFTGRLQAVDYVEVRPEVSGKIQEIKFKDGQNVSKGDVLIVIDPAPYQAAADKAKADLSIAMNQYDLARKDLDRAQDLVKSNAISKRIFDERQNAVNVSRSQIEAAKAQLNQAEIDLDHAYVKAPISGRISRAEITEGNLVNAAANPPILTSIVSDEGIYADFEVDEKTYLQDIYAVARDKNAQVQIPVEIDLSSGNEKSYKGVIESFDNKIDPKSGTIRVRAYLDNEDQSLLPGMFVNIRLGSAKEDAKFLVSEKAIGTDQDRKFVYVIGDGNKVQYREVKPGVSINGQRVILSGLEPGDKVITEGIMKIRPDMIVEPQEITAQNKALEAPALEPAAE